MSVRKGDQEQGELRVITALRELFKYTKERVEDDKTFPKAKRWLIAKAIWDALVGANTNKNLSAYSINEALLLFSESEG